MCPLSIISGRELTTLLDATSETWMFYAINNGVDVGIDYEWLPEEGGKNLKKMDRVVYVPVP